MTGPKLPILKGYMMFNPDAPEGSQYMRKGLRPSKTPKIWATLGHLKLAITDEVKTHCYWFNRKAVAKNLKPEGKYIFINNMLKGWKVYDVTTGEEIPNFIHDYLVEKANKMKTGYYANYEIVDLWQ